MGNWGTMYQAEQDIAIEEFCPFNNRKLLMILLSVDKDVGKVLITNVIENSSNTCGMKHYQNL